MTPLSPDRLVLPEEAPEELEIWRARHIDAPRDRPIPVGKSLASALNDLTGLLGASPSWWGGTLLREHLYGRVRVEQIDPIVRYRRYGANSVPGDAEPLRVTAALYEDLSVLAEWAKLPEEEYARQALTRQLFGNRPVDELPDLGRYGWDVDSDYVKVWLPESVNEKLSTLAEFLGLSRSDVVRNQLLLGLIGRLNYTRAVAASLWAPNRREPDRSGVMFHRSSGGPLVVEETEPAARTAFIQKHGKSVDAFKCYLPPAMKALLEQQASLVGRRLSHHLREQLLLGLEGHLSVAPGLPMTVV